MPFQLFPVSGFSGMVYFCKNKKAQEVNLNPLGANPLGANPPSATADELFECV